MKSRVIYVLLLSVMFSSLYADVKLIKTSNGFWVGEKSKRVYLFSTHILCIDNYKYLVSGKHRTVTQMYKVGARSDYPPQPIRCK